MKTNTRHLLTDTARTIRSTALGIAAVLFAAAATCRAHEHFTAGFSDSNTNGVPDPGEPLALIDTPLGGVMYHLLPRPVGNPPSSGIAPIVRCGGYYVLDERPRTLHPADAFSFVGLSDGTELDEEPGHAHSGSNIWVEIVSVDGPAGGRFGYWEQGRSDTSTTPTVSFLTGQPTGSFRFVVSEGSASDPDADPYGHIHNRSWTADKPGQYVVGLRLVDRATSNGGGPWHAPSSVFHLSFSAAPSFAFDAIESTAGSIKLTWPSRMGIYAPDLSQKGVRFGVMRSQTPNGADAVQIGEVVGTTADIATFTDNAPPAGRAFYWLHYEWSTN